ncbi:multicomponent Na+:H+ antiporter subunit G [Virgibacillus natechei]|uniref:Multicomponent Na+:H+ antiporter subunit G n=1 Tax=Virgibacillus natechei TaxID=1216297 RepID=A0ABS4IK55_9BACI|nr:Na+/H+ antiporter subunit G [Virgibacillus natechei]MBP1971311.1 multicomponent Na+:H+ antiporter subunit G [Virgibacillus natechei]UZD12954.1 Na+/H+ antiporter subunit G [Virgibacillus natechei]
MNVSEILEFLSALLILLGAIISVISAIGLIRFPDVYTRSHAATKSAALAVLLTLVGAFFYLWITQSLVSVRLLLGILFVFITAPVSGHLICRAAYRSNVKMADTATEDELEGILRQNE